MSLAPSHLAALVLLLRLSAPAAEIVAVFPAPQYTALKPGLDFAQIHVESVPWRIHLVRLDRRQPGLQLRSTLGGGEVIGLATVPAQARACAAPGWTPLAAVNGGYFREARGPERGTLAGLLILDGELLSRPANTSFWVDATNGLHIAVVHAKMEITWPDGTTSPLGLNELPATNRPALITPRYGSQIQVADGLAVELRAPGGKPFPALRASSNYTAVAGAHHAAGRIAIPRAAALLLAHPAQHARLEALADGAILRFTTACSHDLSSARTALGAGPTLLTGGVANPSLLRPGADARRNPRTAVGFNDRYCFLVVVDGRGLRSAGMNYAELTRLLTQLGCTEAINLDGGTSTTLWVNGDVVNSPSGWLTPAVADALVILHRDE